ncbi:hypothetical protein DFJ58DRAFT_475709 [Suillus subalutaceus]|uniref:uncharacterized protein n=1 Tax=Suillus subalutaceus TaxID=48586 RepID=UPI001B886F56|nr:uncharacterized protein DFJ58DRAFT_475709 [Suillus subalutaceus]KAG1848093.1 hypothetical protein DFJ58DRAFT_475709 [Suillus subalutaceus]
MGHGHGHRCPSLLPPIDSLRCINVRAFERITECSWGYYTRPGRLGLHGAGEMGNDGHHHHWGDERPEMFGRRRPLGLIIIALLLLVTSIVFEHHDVLVRVTNIHLPFPLPLFQRSRLHTSFSVPGRGQVQVSWERILRNPYTLPPILFCVTILGG